MVRYGVQKEIIVARRVRYRLCNHLVIFRKFVPRCPQDPVAERGTLSDFLLTLLPWAILVTLPQLLEFCVDRVLHPADLLALF